MNKTELAKAVARQTDVTNAEASQVVSALFDIIEEAIADNVKVSIGGFGAFERRHRKARTARNPQTGATMEVPAKHYPAFKAAKRLKDAVAG